MTCIFDYLLKSIDYKLVLLIIIGAYWVKYNLVDFLPYWRLKYKVLAIAIILTVGYHFMLIKAGVFEPQNVANYLFSYVFATSFYEIALQPLEEWAKKLFSKKEGN